MSHEQIETAYDEVTRTWLVVRMLHGWVTLEDGFQSEADAIAARDRWRQRIDRPIKR